MDENPTNTGHVPESAPLEAPGSQWTYTEQLNTQLTDADIEFYMASFAGLEPNSTIPGNEPVYANPPQDGLTMPNFHAPQTAGIEFHEESRHDRDNFLMSQTPQETQQYLHSPEGEGGGQSAPFPAGYGPVRPENGIEEAGVGYGEQPIDEIFQLFCSGDEGSNAPRESDGNPTAQVGDRATAQPKKAASGAKRQRSKKQTTINSQQKKKTANLGFEAFGNQKKGRKAKRASGGGVQKKSLRNKAKDKRRSKQAGLQNLNFDSLFSSNLIQAAKANASKDAIPSFKSRNKAKALREIVSSITTTENNKRVITADRKALMESASAFTRKPKPDGSGGWLHPNMTTSLFHYQLIGVSFMRTREAASIAPFGGFLCDEMGFGKTIQAIANMVDGIASGDSSETKTTLLVVPPHLVIHWKKQIHEHTKPGVLGAILPYHAQSRVDADFLFNTLSQIGVIITTYSEVRSSCPDFNPPPELADGDECRNWWKEHFDKNCGPLHLINFRRIILDEAHEIKNHESKTSIAVSMLNGKFRWVISGTPVHNSAQEFYSYFRFLRIPQTGDFAKFRRTYCPDNVASRTRMINIFRAYMLRRTHEETLFGLPILKLPDIYENTIVVKFSASERFLYKAMVAHSVDNFIFGPDPETYGLPSDPFRGRWFKLLMKIRMFTSHMFVAQDFLKHILTLDTMRKLRAAVSDDPKPEDLETCFILDKLVNNQPVVGLDAVRNSSSPSINQYEVAKAELMAHYTQQSAILSASNAPRICMDCRCPPGDNFYFTSCMHFYCQNCYENPEGETKSTQCKCGLVIEEAIRIDESPPGTAMGNNDATDDLGVTARNWVAAAGPLMPCAKLTAIKSLVTGWLNESADTKVAIFTQFLSMVDLLSLVCQSEGWGFATLTGKIPPASRDKIVDDFRKNQQIRVMIASLKAGGTGLSLTMARKCILIDLWWNEAIEQQAFCRLFRIGQTNDVEMVRITAENTMDDRIQEIQQIKTADIESAIGSKVLAGRDSLADLLEIFGVSPEDYALDGKDKVEDETVNDEENYKKDDEGDKGESEGDGRDDKAKDAPIILPEEEVAKD